MNKTLLCSLFLLALVSSKIIILDESDLPKLLRSLSSKGSSINRKLEEADEGDNSSSSEASEASEESETSEGVEAVNVFPDAQLPFIPRKCYYRGGLRPGFEVDGDSWVMTPSKTERCKDPQDFLVEKDVLWSGQDLSNCKGLEYNYTSRGEDVSTVLYYVRTSGVSEGLPEVHAGYMSSETKGIKLYMYNSVYNYRSWMGDVYILCMKA